MGTYLHPGKDAYEEAVNSKIFIDKTEMILFLNSIIKTRQKYLCVSRPRRFGKTTAADMICAYYDCDTDSRSLFEKRKLAGSNPLLNGDKELPWDAYLEKFDVIRIVMTDFISDSDSARDMLDCLTEEIVDELCENYPDVKFANRIKLSTGMSKIYGKTKRQFVIVIDEWDAVFRTWENAASDQKEYLDFLRDWLKDKPSIALVYMTGILPIKKYGNHSALNMFTEYSMITPRQLAPYTGFTEDEVQSLCRQYGRDYDAIKNWYEG
ncbi:MAG: AAA family ATPase, partial [Clostridia bacterium]|nr:AAA family ATPase [Clostridia bacterium]